MFAILGILLVLEYLPVLANNTIYDRLVFANTQFIFKQLDIVLVFVFCRPLVVNLFVDTFCELSFIISELTCVEVIVLELGGIGGLDFFA